MTDKNLGCLALRSMLSWSRVASEHRRNIQGVFVEAGMEIMSPHYRHHREGNETTIPPVVPETGTIKKQFWRFPLFW